MVSSTSALVCVGPYTYFFVNEPDTSFITFYRYADITVAPTTGKIGTKDGEVEVGAGAIAAIKLGDGLRLYYLIEGAIIAELILDNANTDRDLKKDFDGGKKSELFNKFHQTSQAKAFEGSFLVACVGAEGLPLVLYQQKGNKSKIGFFNQEKKSSGAGVIWKSDVLMTP